MINGPHDDEAGYSEIPHYRHNRAGKVLVQTSTGSGYKTRAARLINCKGFGARWVNRDKGYVMSRTGFTKFAKAYASGADGCIITRQIEHAKA